MQKLKILGIVGSPRKNGNTMKLVEAALEGARSITGVETEIYEMAGKKYHHCTGCLYCLKAGKCVFKDDLQEFASKYMDADGIIMGAPIYHMGIPASMKCALDRFGNYMICNFISRSEEIPRLNKVCGVLTVGAQRHGGQEMTLSSMINSALLMNNFVISGDTLRGSYIGAAGWPAGPEKIKTKDGVLGDELGISSANNLGQRVAEATKIVKAGLTQIKNELPIEYSYRWEER